MVSTRADAGAALIDVLVRVHPKGAGVDDRRCYVIETVVNEAIDVTDAANVSSVPIRITIVAVAVRSTVLDICRDGWDVGSNASRSKLKNQDKRNPTHFGLHSSAARSRQPAVH